MMRKRKTASSRFSTGIVNITIAGIAVLSPINIGSTQAAWAEKEVPSFNLQSEYPLLADSRRENRDFDKGQPSQESKHKRKFYNNEVRKADRKTNKNRDYRDYRDYRDHRDHRDHRQWDDSGKNKLWRSKEKNRHHFTPRHIQKQYYPTRVYPRHPHRGRVVVRPLRHHYPRHRNHYYNSDLWGWVAFTAITLTLLDDLNDQQQRVHERALYNATAAPLGETVIWRDGAASGSITPIEEGTSSAGRYCREFRHDVTIDGNVESLFGTACQNADGSWEIVQ